MDADPRTDPFIRRPPRPRSRGSTTRGCSPTRPSTRRDGRATRRSNLDVLFGPDGKSSGTYAKRHLVPFGEYVPFRRLLEGWISALDQVPRDFAAGHEPGLFDVAGHADRRR